MADVFISYSHRDQAFALQLVGALAQRGSTAWLDRNDVLPARESREDIQARIEEAGAFLFLLSPESVISEECNKELDYAESCGKKLIPVLQREVNPDLVPQALRDLDWITDASFDHLLEKVLDALLTDKEDWNRSGRLQRLSREWEKNHKQNASLLLHGKELKSAEEWLKRTERWRLEGSHKKLQPDEFQIQFIRASRRGRNRFLLTGMLVVLLLIGCAGAGTFSFLYHDPTLVTTQQDGPVGSLRWAVANAPSNSTITFATNLSGETIVLTGDLVIPAPKHLTLKYTGPGKLRISLAKNTILVNAGASLTLFHLSLLGGTSNSETLLTNFGTLTLIGSTVSGNTSVGTGGGGILNEGTMTLTNSIISGNTAANGGGGILNFGGTMTLTNSTVSRNTASDYGGGGINNTGTMTLTNSTVTGNTTANGGDGGDGGGINNDGTMTLMNSTVTGNTASGSGGGGIYNSGTMTLTNSTVTGNTASVNGSGGGIENVGGTMTLMNSTISGNTASVNGGGGIFSAESTTTLMNSTISGNTAAGPGGGIYNYAAMTLMNSTISGNTAAGPGGGIYNSGGPVSLTFCTLYGNQATDGGGLTTEDTPPAVPGDSTIQNSLIAGNSAPQHPDIAGKLTSKGYNLIQNRAGAIFIPTTGDQFVSDLSRVFASNVHLENNGGPTQTLALLTDPANPARGAIPLASCQIKEIYDAHARIYIDQRGAVRPGNKKTACDIGAYETQM